MLSVLAQTYPLSLSPELILQSMSYQLACSPRHCTASAVQARILWGSFSVPVYSTFQCSTDIKLEGSFALSKTLNISKLLYTWSLHPAAQKSGREDKGFREKSRSFRY